MNNKIKIKVYKFETIFVMFVIINNVLYIFNIVKSNIVKCFVATFDKIKNSILVYKCFWKFWF